MISKKNILYPKKNEPTLSAELFASPTAEYRAMPFWSWNCKLEKDELLRQIDDLRAMGYGGFHMHVRPGLDTEYLGEEFMQMVGACVGKAKNEKLLAWLYDEDRWPSGHAGGMVTREEKYRMRHLLFTAHPYRCEAERFGVPYRADIAGRRRSQAQVFIARYDIVQDEAGYMTAYRMLTDGDTPEGTVWYAYAETPECHSQWNGETYVNTLDRAAIERFIEITHEAYRARFSDEFGKTIPAIFTDEPATSLKQYMKFSDGLEDTTLAYTDDLEQTFTAAYGFSLIAHIPELFFELPEGQVSRTRYCYHDHVAERFAAAFSDTLCSWCEANGLMLTGHLRQEATLTSQTRCVGDAMRSYRAYHLPGVDMLCNNHEYNTCKQAQSVANQMGCEGMMDELYGVCGWDYDFRRHKLQGDWQAALGVTLRVPHVSLVSLEGEGKRDYPASFNYQSPWYREYCYVEDHYARVNTAMVRGVPVSRVGVIHPLESYWLHWGPADLTGTTCTQKNKRFSDLTEWLLFGSIDFDFICEANLPAQCAQGSVPFRVGEMQYDVLIVPACETLRRETVERLEQFKDAGGHLIFLGAPPKYIEAEPSDRPAALYRRSDVVEFARDEILRALAPYRTLELRNDNGTLTENLLYRMRREGDDLWVFVAHGKDPGKMNIPAGQRIRIRVPGHYAVTLYDTLSGEIKPIAHSHKGMNTVIPAELYQEDSLLLHLTPTEAAPEQLPAAPKTTKQPIRVPHAVDYTLDEPNMLLLDMAEWALDDEEFAPAEEILRISTAAHRRCGWPPIFDMGIQPWCIPDLPPEHVLHLRYTIDSEIAYADARLGIENPQNATIRFNGEPVDCTPIGWYADRSIKTIALPRISPGRNLLEVDLAYTQKTAAEAMYLLGMFGVRVEGYHAVVTRLPEKLAFGSIVPQGLPFYGGKLTYHFSLATNGNPLAVAVEQYRAAVLRVHADGNDGQILAYAPNIVTFDDITAGEHRIDIDAYISRSNGFGTLHDIDDKRDREAPSDWRVTNSRWCYEYNFKPEGILTTPRFDELIPR